MYLPEKCPVSLNASDKSLLMSLMCYYEIQLHSMLTSLISATKI